MAERMYRTQGPGHPTVTRQTFVVVEFCRGAGTPSDVCRLVTAYYRETATGLEFMFEIDPKGGSRDRVLSLETPYGNVCGRENLDVINVAWPEPAELSQLAEWERVELRPRLAPGGQIRRRT